MKKLSLILAVMISLCQAAFSYDSLPAGYKGIKLGMSVDEVKTALKRDATFGYTGDRDVSFLPGTENILIETDTSKTAPYSFLERCWFQFYEEKLYVITINVKPSKMDHYSIFSTLCKKYGNPPLLNPEKSQWSDDSVIMSLERPLTLKYTDKKVYDKILEESLVEDSAQEYAAKSFLEEL